MMFLGFFNKSKMLSRHTFKLGKYMIDNVSNSPAILKWVKIAVILMQSLTKDLAEMVSEKTPNAKPS